MERLKVLFHINDGDRWGMVLSNIANLLRDVGAPAVDAAVLANGKAVVGFGDAEKLAAIGDLAAQGVRFMACRNSLRSLCDAGVVCLKEEQLPSFVSVVPAGITEIIRLQHAGYAYVKP